jgi:hypothetical protein
VSRQKKTSATPLRFLQNAKFVTLCLGNARLAPLRPVASGFFVFTPVTFGRLTTFSDKLRKQTRLKRLVEA